MYSLISLIVLVLFLLGLVVMVRERRRIYEWLRKPGNSYYESKKYQQIKLERELEDIQAELDWLNEQEAKEEAGE